MGNRPADAPLWCRTLQRPALERARDRVLRFRRGRAGQLPRDCPVEAQVGKLRLDKVRSDQMPDVPVEAREGDLSVKRACFRKGPNRPSEPTPSRVIAFTTKK